MKERFLFPEEEKRMNTSKVIKTEDKEKLDVKSFFLKQFPGGESGSGNVKMSRGLATGHRPARARPQCPPADEGESSGKQCTKRT
jgi:hypothetical protein